MTSKLKRFERSPPVVGSIKDAIRQYIIDNDLKPGDPLISELEFSRQLGVSRNSVREAVQSLASIGLLEARHGSGLFVSEFSWDPLLGNLAYDLLQDLSQLSDLLNIRRVLETGMISDAIKHSTPGQVEQLRTLLGKMAQRSEQGEAFPEEDREFHRVLFSRIQNPTLLKLLDIFWLAFSHASSRPGLRDEDPASTYRSHIPIVDALELQQVEEAQLALERHYEAILRRLSHQFDEPVSATSDGKEHQTTA